METRNIRVVLAYDGTDFCGWQSQSSGRTVQDVFESALQEMHGRPVSVRVAGRTDSGVHADGQVVNFRTDGSVPAERFVNALNQVLPSDVRAIESDQVAEGFDARFDARLRVYKYRLAEGLPAIPTERRYVWTLKRFPDPVLLARYAAKLVGAHDFTTFAAAGDTSVSRVREVHSSSFYFERGRMVFKIAANAFLYRMVRSLVGTMIELAVKGAAPEELAARLAACDREAAGQTAPPWGLFLHKVLYDERDQY